MPEQHALAVHHVGDGLRVDVLAAADSGSDGPDKAGQVLLTGLPNGELDVVGLELLLDGVVVGDAEFAVVSSSTPSRLSIAT